MGRTNNMWKIDLFYDTNKKDFIKTLTATTLREIAYLFNMEVYDISNFYHGITKPKGVFMYITLSKN
tara:strand:- start:941 stop:1141 length:201 start_codon:yes stop_codon:yes gene_type:complete